MDRPVSLESRRIDLATEAAFQLGRTKVEPAAHEIITGNKAVRIQPRVLKVLVALHDKLGQVVSRDELVSRCWDGRIVGEDVINRCVSLLRSVAAESAGFRIETVSGAGYRLLETMTAVAARSSYFVAAISLAIVAFLLIGLAAFWRASVEDQSPILAVSIPPFKSDTADLSLSAIAAQARNSTAHMLAQSGVSVSLGDQGERERVPDYDIRGAFSGGPAGIRAIIQIEDLKRGVIVFSHEFDAARATSADLPDQIGANLAAALSWAAPLLILDRSHPSNPALIAQFLNQVSTEDFDQMRAFQFIRQTAPNSPNSPIAQLLMATTTGLMFHSLATKQRPAAVKAGREAAARAMLLAPRFGDVYIPNCLLQPATLLRKCEDNLRAGLAADSDAPFVPAFLSRLLNNVGRTRAAADLAYSSLAADQFAPSKIGRLSGMLEATGESAAADRLYRQGMRWWPENHNMFWMRYSGIIQRGDFRRLAQFEREIGRSNVPEDYYPASMFADAVAARSHSALRKICRPRDPGNDLKAIECMVALTEIGDVNDAFVFANLLYPDRLGRTPQQQTVIWLAEPIGTDSSYITSPATTALRRDPRYLILARRIGLLGYWRQGRLPDFCVFDHEPVCKLIERREPSNSRSAGQS